MYFRKGFGSQHILIVLIENWKKIPDKESGLGAPMIELSKEGTLELKPLSVTIDDRFTCKSHFCNILKKSHSKT